MLHDLRAGPELGISATVQDRPNAHCATVSLHGELNSTSSAALASTLDALIDDGVQHLRVQLAGLTGCTGEGVDVLGRARGRAEAAGGSLELVNANGLIRRIFELTNLPLTVTQRERS